MMRTLDLDFGDRSYSIHVGRDLEGAFRDSLPAGRRAVALVDAFLPEVQSERLDRYLGGMPRLIVPRGEGSKSLSELERLSIALLQLGLSRDGLLIAVGGGVTGDLCGAIAACYFRGIPFIQLPTTLLAQLDSSVGGKVAVNLPGAKNALGYFHQPRAVITDLGFLDTLDPREKRAGLAEMIKMAAVGDPELVGRIEEELPAHLAENGEALCESVLRACELKAAVVQSDERESGLREILNFGHTLGHAVELSAVRPPWLHGEAVALGMLAALRIGERMGRTAPGRSARMDKLLARAGLPRRLPPGLDLEDILERMRHDKKGRRGELRWVLLKDWGSALRGQRVELALLKETLEALRP